MSDLFNAIVTKSGLSPIFAKTVVDRAIRRAGFDPAALQRSDLDKLLPELERALTVYLGDGTASDRAAAIKRDLAK